MCSQAIQRLPILQPDSDIRLSHVISGIRGTNSYRLIRQHAEGGIGGTYTPRDLSQLRYCEKRFTLSASQRDFMHGMNEDLKGGSKPHPVLMAALGTATGFLFTVATTGLDVYSKDTDVLARTGDEIWLVEEIGRVEKNYFVTSRWAAMHVASYFLYDPFRANSNGKKGWLIHESRTELKIE